MTATVKAGYQPLSQRSTPSTSAEDVLQEQEQLLSGDDEQSASDLTTPFPVKTTHGQAAQLRWINFILGAAILLPWNAVITAMPYFLSRLAGSKLQSTFSTYLSATFTVAGFCFLSHATATSKQSNLSRRIRRSLFALTLLLLLLVISTYVTSPPSVFYFFILLNGLCQSAAGAYLQSAVVAVASLFGPSVIQSVMSGQAAVGVAVSLVQLLSAWAGIHSEQSSNGSDEYGESATRAAFLFFGVATIFMGLTIFLHTWLLNIPAYKTVVLPLEASADIGDPAVERETMVQNSSLQSSRYSEKGHITEVAKMNLEFNLTVAYVFAVTLSVFPPITSSIRSVNPPSTSIFSHPLLFMAIHFLIFNIGDLVGRYLPTISTFQVWSSRRLMCISLSRTVFIPLFLLCNLHRPSSSFTSNQAAKGPIINSDVLFFLLLLAFGVTNGWVASLVMMAAPSIDHNPRLRHREKDIDTAATIAQFFLVGGLAVGSFMSFGVKGAVCACNPFVT